MTAIKFSLLSILESFSLDSRIQRLTNTGSQTNQINLCKKEVGLCPYVDKTSISANCQHPTASDYKNSCRYCIVSEEGVCINPNGSYKKG